MNYHTYFHFKITPKAIKATSQRYSENYKQQVLNFNTSRMTTITQALRETLIINPKF